MFKPKRRIQQLQFMKCLLLNPARKPSRKFALPDSLSLTAFKTDNQPNYSTLTDISVNRYHRQLENNVQDDLDALKALKS